jgi:diguanylate cyclase (GGDEF)-like protein
MPKSISGRITFNLVAGILLTVLTIVGAVYWMAVQHNEAAAESTHTMVVGGLHAMTRRLQTTTNDYSWWEEAYDAFIRSDDEWIENNIGTGVTETEIADLLAIISPTGEIAYGWTIAGEEPASLLPANIIASLEKLIADASVDNLAARSAYIATPSGPMLISVSRIAPVSRADEVNGAELPLLTMALYLSDRRLGDLGKTFLINDLRFLPLAAGTDVGGNDFEAAVDIGGEPLGKFAWTPPRPGQALIERVALPLALAISLFCGIALWTATRARSMAVDLATSEKHALEAARTDSLTGLINRHGFNQITESLAPAPDERLGIIYLDVNGFKAVNDSIGHHGGDDLVKALANRLVGVLPPSASLARVGGDEFSVLVRGANVGELIPSGAASLIHAADLPFSVSGFEFHVSVAVGYAVADSDVRAEEVLRRADLAMYQAKGSGDREAVAYHPNMETGALEKKQIEKALRPALERRELKLVYQPIVRASDHAIVGLEALARWPSKELGMVSPDVFIPVAEETGLIHDIGRYMFEQACEDAARWPGLCIAVNVSPVQLRDPSFCDDLVAILERYHLSPDRFELELTEGILVKNPTLAKRKLDRLKEVGFKLSLDDFGTGFSSIGYLRQFPFDKLKIDRCFVREIGLNPTANALIQALVSLGEAMELAVVAEGIELKTQLDLLRLLRCEFIQGYYFSKPLPAADIADLLVEASAFGAPKWRAHEAGVAA